MEGQTATELIRTPENLKPSGSDWLFERVQEINDLIARRAYELFEASGFTNGHDLERQAKANQVFRVLDLPATIDLVQVKATLSNGVLEVTLLKAETGKQIPVLTKAASA